jgi:hypothetical protein
MRVLLPIRVSRYVLEFRHAESHPQASLIAALRFADGGGNAAFPMGKTPGRLECS